MGQLKRSSALCMLGFRNFHEAYFGDVADLETASAAAFKVCMKGNSLLFCEG
ncbi:hypothetical protein DL95DRAFT_397844 [Leptodontidium sp. 2 PMI_412]|nr:hypothetical protein DL95DRAFT_397844 [Leptodontidium sp. 2 PMI_412]